MWKRAFLVGIIVLVEQSCEGKQGPEVTIAQGKLQGEYKTSRSGKTFASFTKIPYAKPPIGDLRFKAPEPADDWVGVYDATQAVPKCMQKDYISYNKPSVEGVEDCLYINVYTPKSALQNCNNEKKLLPVMVFIHYGGTVAGSSQPESIGPEYFMDKRVLMVSFNYRLGIFGYFSTLNDDAPGNWAHKDQIAALRWVQANIEHFGGDKDRVTIFGQSAGAGAVHHLMLSPSGQGLFHRAISQSGTAMNLWSKPLNLIQEKIFPATARIFGCENDDTAVLVECLRKVDAEALANSIEEFKYFYRDPIIVYSIVIETRSDKNPEPFLEHDPSESILSGQFARVPWILGTVENEGGVKSGPYFADNKIRREYLSNFMEYSTQDMLAQASVLPEQIPEFLDTIHNFYLRKNITDLTVDEQISRFSKMYGDRWFSYGAYQAALMHAMQGHSPIWFYNFNFRGSVTYANTVFMNDADDPIEYDFGVSHCDDLLYTLYSPSLFPDYVMTPEELQMSKIMVTFWTNFAITGNPHKEWQPLPIITNGKATNKDLHFLDIRGPSDMVLRNNYKTKRMNFWVNSKIFENVPGIE